MEKAFLNVDNDDAENNSEEEPVNELLEQIKRRLKEEWDSASVSNTIKATAEKEFERLLKVYQDQGRTAEALTNLLSAVEATGDVVEKLTLFYKDTVYNKHAKMEKNQEGSLDFALDYIKLLNLSPADLKRFEEIMRGEK